MKILMIILIVLQALLILWNSLKHFNLIEGEEAYDDPFPWVELLILLVFIVVFVIIK